MVHWAEKNDLNAARGVWKARANCSEAFASCLFKLRIRPKNIVVNEIEIEKGTEITSTAMFRPVVLRIRGHEIEARMLSGAATQLVYEKKGYFSENLRFAMQDFAEEDIPVVVAKPQDIRVFKSSGFATVTEAAALFLSNDELRTLRETFANAVPGDDVPKLIYGLNSDIIEEYDELIYFSYLYNEAHTAYSGIAVRDQDECSVKAHDYLCYDLYDVDDDEVVTKPGYILLEDGYAFFEVAENTARIREIGWTSEDGKHRIFAALLSQDALSDCALKGKLPAGSNELFSDLRIVPDTAAACCNISVLLRKIFNDPKYCVEITDSVIEENNGIFDFSGQKTDRCAQLTMRSSALIQFVFGYRSLSELAAQGLAVVYDAAAVSELDEIYPKQNCFTWDEY